MNGPKEDDFDQVFREYLINCLYKLSNSVNKEVNLLANTL